MQHADVLYRWRSLGFQRISRIVRPHVSRTSGTAANVRTTLVAMLMAFGLFAIFASHETRGAARDLPGHPVSDMLVETADRWHTLMQHLGPAHLRPAVRALLDRARSAPW